MDANIEIATAARAEAGRMREAVTGQPDRAPVRMSAGQFKALAALLDQLADRSDLGEGGGACWLDRSWVPLQHLESTRRRLAACEAEIVEARAQLTAREADNVRLTSLAFGLVP